MNEKLQEALADTIIKATQSAEQASEFILAEMPDVVQQLLMWKMMEAALLFIIPFLMFVIWSICFKTIWPKARAKGDETEFAAFMAFVISGIVLMIAMLHAVCCDLFTCLQIYVAPKVYLLEYASTLIK